MSDRLEELLYKSLSGQDPERMRDFLRQRAELKEIKLKLGPQTKEELWRHIKDKVGVELSTVAVCPGHTSQLDMVWDLYSFAKTRVLWVMNRGGGKTSLAAWIDDVQAEFYPGWGSFTIGANRNQGDRKYEYLLPLVVEGGIINGKELEHVARSIATRTQYKNGSSIEIAQGSSPENANGPRTPRLHRDEIELMDPKTKKQAGMIPAGRQTRDGRYVPAQILDTSTMKYAEGPVDLEIQAYNKAIEEGRRPQMDVVICCIYENSAENPFCRSVPDEERRARLRELGLPEDKICDCDTYISDVWPAEDDTPNAEPEPRTLESVCQGRFFRSRGHKGFDDVQTLFLEADREQWQAEQECSQPATEGAYIKSYTQVRNGIKGFIVDPANGIIDQGIDFGADDEHAVIWFQTLDVPVTVKAYVSGEPKVLPTGAVVAFGEIFESGIGNIALGQKILAKEAEWSLSAPGFRVFERYPDSANLNARLDLKDELGLETTSRIKKDFAEELKLVRTRIGAIGGFYVCIDECPWFDKSIRAWRQENGREVRSFATHMMAAFRYREHNVQVATRRAARDKRNSSVRPVAADDAGDRVREREEELVAAGATQTNQLRRQPEPIEMAVGDDDRREVYDQAAAEDSPLRETGRSMGSESEWVDSFGRPVR